MWTLVQYSLNGTLFILFINTYIDCFPIIKGRVNHTHTHTYKKKIMSKQSFELSSSAKMWNGNVSACIFCHWILDSLMSAISIHYCITIVWSDIDVNWPKLIAVYCDFWDWGKNENEMRNVKLIKSFSGLGPFQLTNQFHSTHFFLISLTNAIWG